MHVKWLTCQSKVSKVFAQYTEQSEMLFLAHEAKDFSFRHPTGNKKNYSVVYFHKHSLDV